MFEKIKDALAIVGILAILIGTAFSIAIWMFNRNINKPQRPPR